MVMHTHTSAGVVGMVGLSRYCTCTWAGVEQVCKEPTTATITVSPSSHFKPILLMQCTVRSHWRWVAYLCELSCKNGVHFGLQICNWKRAGMGPPTLQISDKFVKICSHSTNCTKTEFFWPKTGFGHSISMRCSCHKQQRQKLPTEICQWEKVGLHWVLEQWWLSSYTVQNTVRKLFVSYIIWLIWLTL